MEGAIPGPSGAGGGPYPSFGDLLAQFRDAGCGLDPVVRTADFPRLDTVFFSRVFGLGIETTDDADADAVSACSDFHAAEGGFLSQMSCSTFPFYVGFPCGCIEVTFGFLLLCRSEFAGAGEVH